MLQRTILYTPLSSVHQQRDNFCAEELESLFFLQAFCSSSSLPSPELRLACSSVFSSSTFISFSGSRLSFLPAGTGGTSCLLLSRVLYFLSRRLYLENTHKRTRKNIHVLLRVVHSGSLQSIPAINRSPEMSN